MGETLGSVYNCKHIAPKYYLAHTHWQGRNKTNPLEPRITCQGGFRFTTTHLHTTTMPFNINLLVEIQLLRSIKQPTRVSPMSSVNCRVVYFSISLLYPESGVLWQIFFFYISVHFYMAGYLYLKYRGPHHLRIFILGVRS